MTLEQVYQACLGMKLDERREFELSRTPTSDEIIRLIAKLGSVRGVNYSIIRSDTHLWVHCYPVVRRW